MSTDPRSPGRMRLGGGVLVVAAVVAALSISGASAAPGARGQARTGPVREAQVFEAGRTGVVSPVGLAYSSSSNAFYVVAARGPIGVPETDVAKLTPFSTSSTSERSATSRIAAAIGDPINLAFDAHRNRLLLLGHARALFEVRVGSGGDLDRLSLNGRDATRFGLNDPQGLAVDPGSGTVFVLDAAQPRILRIEPSSDGGFETATISEIELGPAGLSSVRGLAFDPASGNLFVGSGRSLVELSANGVVVTTRDLSPLALAKPEGLVFAPSGDRTDASSQLSLYLADSGTAPTGSKVSPSSARQPGPSEGQIVELSLEPQIAAAAVTFTSQLVRTVDMGALSPPSPDPSGITYVPSTDRLLVSDGEVEETVGGVTHFQGANIWELNRNGLTLARTANVSKRAPIQVAMTDEPAGAGFNSATGHYLFAEDGGKRIYDLNPGADGIINAGDTFTFFGVNGFGNTDPEGVTFNPVNGRVYVADGVNREVYEYTPAGALLGHFDTARYGVDDPEAVEANPQTGTLFVLSNRQSGPIIIETTTAGALLQTIDVSAADGEQKPAGLAYANASNGSGVKRFYWVDRGIDNDNNKFAVDGKLYEMTAPGGGPPPPNSPPVITSNGGGANGNLSVPENQTAVTTVTATDADGDTLTYSTSGGADQAAFAIDPSTGVLTFVTAPNFEAPTDVGGNNVYNVTVQVSDGQGGSDSQALAVTVTNVAENPPVINSNDGGATASVSAAENQTAVTDVDATDPDGDAITYATAGGADEAAFAIDPSTGVLTFVSAPDFEAPTDAGQNNVYDVTVQASDPGGLSDTQAIAVTVTNVAENPPVINSNGGGATASVSAAENQSAVTDVDATDPDGDAITYATAGGADEAAFAIDPSTGVLTFVSAPDFEAPTDAGGNNVYDVVVSASDGSLSDTQTIAVTVTDVEESPVITSDGGGATASVSAAENQSAVTDVDATDPDGDAITYATVGGADESAFAIDPSTGVLTFVSAPDFEAPTDAGGNNVYDVVVSASDGSLTDTQAIAVTVTNVVDTPEAPVIGGGDTAAVSAPENQTAVTDVDATDPNGDTITYATAGGADEAAFAIDPSTGVLTFLSAPDFEAPTDAGGNNVYDVVVSASDGSLADTQAIAVTVTDVAEGSPLYFSVFDPATVGTVSAENEDIVFFNGTTFSLAFDGSDVGLASLRIDAFSWVDANRLLLSFDTPGTISGVAGTTDDSDVVLFTAASLGSNTTGTFSMYFDGSDVGLTTHQEDVDAVELLPDGRILVSTINTASVTGVTSEDEDLLRFTPTQLGATTAGTFSMYFDGGDVGLTTAGEDVDAAAVGADGKLYLSTFNTFSVPGISGADEDVFVFTPGTLGSSTTGTFSSALYFDGSAYGLAVNDVFAIDLP